MADNIQISELLESTTAANSDWIAIDNGTATKKISVQNFNATGAASAAQSAAAAAQSASAALASQTAAEQAEDDAQALITSAQTIVSSAQTYANEASTSAGTANTAANTATAQAAIATQAATQAGTYAQNVDAFAKNAKSWAVGGTGTRQGEDTDNSKYYSQQAHTSEINAATSEANAATSEANAAASEQAVIDSAYYAHQSMMDAAVSASSASSSATTASDSATSAASDAQRASTFALQAKNSKETAEDCADTSQAWAWGKIDGVDVPPTHPAYHNNAKYYADQASGGVSGVSSFNARSGNVVPALGDYSANIIEFDNSSNGFTAGTTQGAIEEVQGNVDTLSNTVNSALADKMDKVNPTGSGAVSIGRRGGSTVGETSVAMGRNVVAGGTGAVAVGVGTEAASFYTFAGGFQSKAQDSGAFAYGIGSISDKRCKAVFGSYNNNRNNTVFEIGNGTSDSARSNIFEIYNDGKISTDNGNTKRDLTALGDMLEATYDGDGTVKNAGGIADYVEGKVAPMLNVLGAKNLLPNVTKTQTVNGITTTLNSDGSVTINGTATGWEQDDILKGLLKKGTYKISIGMSFPSDVFGTLRNDDTNTTILNLGNGSDITEREFTLSTDTNIRLYNGVRQGVTVSNLTFYPMIRLASIEDDTYVPYSMTNQQITPYALSQSNPNLLDNPWFTVNQRGESSYSSRGYTVDRWYAEIWSLTSFTVTPQSNGILLAGTASSVNSCYLKQLIENPSTLAGKTLTLSAITTNNLSVLAGILCVYIDGSYYTSERISSAANGLTQLTFTMPDSVSSMYILIGKHGSYGGAGDTSLLIKAMKLEVGSVSTLAQDTAPNYATELLKCLMSTADSSDAYANRNISGGEIMLEATNTLSTNVPTSYNFNHIGITSNSSIDVYTDIFGINPSDIYTVNGLCSVTFPKQSTAQTMTCRIYVK